MSSVQYKANFFSKNLASKAINDMNKAEKASRKGENSEKKSAKFFIKNALLQEFNNKTDRKFEKKINEQNKENNNIDNDNNKKILLTNSFNINDVELRNDNKQSNLRENSGICFILIFLFF